MPSPSPLSFPALAFSGEFLIFNVQPPSMKKTFTIALLVLAAAACHRKAVPAGGTTTMTSPAPAPAPADAAHAEMVARGKTVYATGCGRCHGLKPVENYTAERWTGILKSMIPKAKLNETEAEQVTAYVMANAKK